MPARLGDPLSSGCSESLQLCGFNEGAIQSWAGRLFFIMVVAGPTAVHIIPAMTVRKRGARASLTCGLARAQATIFARNQAAVIHLLPVSRGKSPWPRSAHALGACCASGEKHICHLDVFCHPCAIHLSCQCVVAGGLTPSPLAATRSLTWTGCWSASGT